MRRIPFVLLSVALLVPAGCQSGAGLPKTYAAEGQVLYKNGQPMKGGSVQFTSADNSTLQVVGTIGEDGRFSLATVRDRARADGAPEGEYHVLILPPLQGEHKGLPPIAVPGTYKVEAKENHFRIELNASP